MVVFSYVSIANLQPETRCFHTLARTLYVAITSHVQLTFCIALQCISIKEFGVRVVVYGIHVHVAIVKDLVSYCCA